VKLSPRPFPESGPDLAVSWMMQALLTLRQLPQQTDELPSTARGPTSQQASKQYRIS
jgi:hypothetical protein